MKYEIINKENIELFVRFYKKSSKNIDTDSLQKNITQNLREIALQFKDVNQIRDILLHEITDYKFSLFHIVAKFGHAEDLKKVVAVVGQSNIDKSDSNNHTALHHASAGGLIENVKILINSGANINAVSSDDTRRWAPIHYATKFGFKEIVVELIQSGVDKNVKTSFGLTPLHVACEFGFYEIAKYLVEIGLDIDLATTEENHCLTPFHYAVMANSIKIVELLCEAGVDRFKTTYKGDDSLIIAVKRNYVDLASFLITCGVSQKLDLAFKIANSKSFLQLANIIEEFIKIQKLLFDKAELIKLSHNFLGEFKKININNLNSFYFDYFMPNKISVYFLLNIRMKVGFIRKKEINLIEYATNAGLNSLASTLVRFEEMVKYRRNRQF